MSEGKYVIVEEDVRKVREREVGYADSEIAGRQTGTVLRVEFSWSAVIINLEKHQLPENTRKIKKYFKTQGEAAEYLMKRKAEMQKYLYKIGEDG